MFDGGINEMKEWRKIGEKTLGSDEKEILLDIDFTKVNGILMFCKTVSADGRTTGQLDIVFGDDIRLSGSIHHTLVRTHYFYAQRIADETWFGSFGYGNESNQNLSRFSDSCLFTSIANVRTIRKADNVGFKVFNNESVSLKAGTTMEIFAR